MPTSTIQQRALTVDEFSKAYRLGRTSIYKLLNAGELSSVRIGKRRLIPVDAAEQLLRRCEVQVAP
jgi:excisionase family DNA binding protein